MYLNFYDLDFQKNLNKVFIFGSLWVLQLHCNRAAIFCIEKKLYLAQWAKSVVFNSIQYVSRILHHTFLQFSLLTCIFDHMYFTQIDLGFVIILQDIFESMYLGSSHWKID